MSELAGQMFNTEFFVPGDALGFTDIRPLLENMLAQAPAAPD
jgi:hypothetical protein